MNRSLNSNQERIKRGKRLIKDFNFYFAVAVLLVATYFLLMASLAPVNLACRLCHSSEFRSFAESPHKELRCSNCHSGISLSGKLNFRFLLSSMPGYLIVDSTRKIEVKNETCLFCHKNAIARTTSGKSGVRMSHREPNAEGYRCADCHTKDAHAAKDLKRGYLEMQVCFECHNGVKAEKKCGYCHTRDDFKVPKNDYPTAYKLIHESLKSHGRYPLKACANCHDIPYCASCHVMVKQYRVVLPHPEDWVGLHPTYTNRRNVRACYACHEKKFCLDCHGLEMPHPETYIRVHIDEAKKYSVNKCYKCHERQGCDFCHQNHRHPGLPSELLKSLRRIAGFE